MSAKFRPAYAIALAGPLLFSAIQLSPAQTPSPAEAPKAEAAKPAAAPSGATKPDEAAKKPSKAELGEMLKKCSEEADAKGLTVQKGKSEARKAYRRSCMLKNGVAAKKK